MHSFTHPSVSLPLSLNGCVYTAGWRLERNLLRSATSSFHIAPFTFSLSQCSALCPRALFKKYHHVHSGAICMDQLLWNVNNTATCSSATLSTFNQWTCCFSFKNRQVNRLKRFTCWNQPSTSNTVKIKLKTM